MRRGHRKAGTGTADCWALGIYPKGRKWPCWPGSTFHSLGGDPGPGRAGDGSHSPLEPRTCASVDASWRQPASVLSCGTSEWGQNTPG